VPDNRVRWLVIGGGDIARKRVAPAIASARDSELRAVCSSNRENAAAIAQQFGAKETFTDPADALARSTANAVYVATPVHRHVPLATEALKSGRHILVEKPLGLSTADAKPLFELAERSQLASGCAYYRRCFPRFAHARKLLEQGALGRVVLARMTYVAWFSPAKDDPKYWRVVPALSGGGPMADTGCHMIDVLIGLLGPPSAITARCANLAQAFEAEDSTSALMMMPDGAHVTASFQWTSKTWTHEFEIIGTEAKLTWTPFDAGPVQLTIGRDTQSIEMPNADNVHQPLIDDFVQAILTRRTPIVPLGEAIKTNRVMDAIYTSAREGAEVAL
jgi:predicted dehydrogenase